ncbi:GIY-YIG nuclease family protein [Nostoc sp. FACHB-190]|uniref:GIY-YIG nuclease family protein n=1 Tax=Nostoc sp. FACHB-190 TaxID=2692838 RepID=UPI0016820090|nr:GIY-YIG nuclease family protein [Nostoc sp. FACHB-190]MBD2303033.1 GIY-YIG nuclease family protein [Nostoc sp. FACHB-190]
MIQPSLIDFKQLPSVSLNQLHTLPMMAGVYFVTNFDTIQYIGKAASLKSRWLNHHRIEQFRMLPNVRVHYLLITDVNEITKLEVIEKAFIEYFTPLLNGTKMAGYQKQERFRIDLWASIKPIIEAEMQRSGLTAQEVVNIALVDYFGLSPKGKGRNTQPLLPVQMQQASGKTVYVSEDEDYI